MDQNLPVTFSVPGTGAGVEAHGPLPPWRAVGTSLKSSGDSPRHVPGRPDGSSSGWGGRPPDARMAKRNPGWRGTRPGCDWRRARDRGRRSARQRQALGRRRSPSLGVRNRNLPSHLRLRPCRRLEAGTQQSPASQLSARGAAGAPVCALRGPAPSCMRVHPLRGLQLPACPARLLEVIARVASDLCAALARRAWGRGGRAWEPMRGSGGRDGFGGRRRVRGRSARGRPTTPAALPDRGERRNCQREGKGPGGPGSRLSPVPTSGPVRLGSREETPAPAEGPLPRRGQGAGAKGLRAAMGRGGLGRRARGWVAGPRGSPTASPPAGPLRAPSPS